MYLINNKLPNQRTFTIQSIKCEKSIITKLLNKINNQIPSMKLFSSAIIKYFEIFSTIIINFLLR